jgi:hypothetical protein
MSNPTRWRLARKITAAAAVWGDLYDAPDAGAVVNVRQLSLSADTALEVVIFYGEASGAAAEAAKRDDELARIFSHEPAANGGAAPDFACLGAWAPQPGMRVRYWISAAGDVHIGLAGTIED